MARRDEDPAEVAVDEDRLLLDYLWAGEEGFFTLNFPHARHYRKPAVWDHVEAAMFFGVLPRVRPRGRSEDVAERGSVAWVDIEDGDGLSRVRELLGPDVRPSALVRSTRGGCHAYWKLSDPIGTEEIERINQALAAHLDGDGSHWDRTVSMRLPGRSKTDGRPAKIVGGTWEVVDPASLVRLADSQPANGRPDTAESERLQPDVALTQHHAYMKDDWLAYIKLYPRKGWINPDATGDDRTRSAKEFSIILGALRGGWSESEILDVAGLLPRQREEFEKRKSWQYTRQVIGKARQVLIEDGVVFDGNGRALATPTTGKASGRGHPWISDYDVLHLCSGQKLAALVREGVELGLGSRSKLYSKVRQLQASGLVDSENALTPDGHRVLAPGWQRATDGVLTQRSIREGSTDRRRLR